MNPKRIVLVALALMAFSPGGARAQAEDLAPEHLALAGELLLVLRMDSIQAEQTREAFSSMPDVAGGEAIQTAMLEFYEKYTSWDVLADDFARAYAERFTAGELRGLIDMFRTPLGQTWVLGSADAEQRRAEITQAALEPHFAELEQIMMRAMMPEMNPETCGPPLCQ